MFWSINYAAVILAAFSIFALGGVWYSPKLFGAIWQREAKSEAKDPHSKRIFIVSFLFALVSALGFAFLLGPDPELQTSLQVGSIVGLLVATSFGINYQFANRSLKLFLIDGGYHALQFIIYGLILGLWN